MPRISNYQAFPVTPNTFVGVATALNMEGRKIVHVNADSTLTFKWDNGKPDVIIVASAGMDFAVDDSCLTLTSTAEVLVES